MTREELRQRAALALLPALWTGWNQANDPIPFADFMGDLWILADTFVKAGEDAPQ